MTAGSLSAEVAASLREHLLAFADDEHLIGQQHTEWIGVAPFLEEDLAFSSIGQDELGHAALLYELVLDLDGIESDDLAIDALAYERGASNYRSCHLAEFVTTDWAEALVRHWLYDTAEQLRWQQFVGSTYTPAAELVDRAEREERYHRLHADSLLDALLATGEGRQRIIAALDTVAILAGGLFAPVEAEYELVSAGIINRATVDLVDDINLAIAARFGTDHTVAAMGGERSTRSDHFAPLMLRMREVLDLDPNAVW